LASDQPSCIESLSFFSSSLVLTCRSAASQYCLFSMLALYHANFVSFDFNVAELSFRSFWVERQHLCQLICRYMTRLFGVDVRGWGPSNPSVRYFNHIREWRVGYRH